MISAVEKRVAGWGTSREWCSYRQGGPLQADNGRAETKWLPKWRMLKAERIAGAMALQKLNPLRICGTGRKPVWPMHSE